MAKELPRFTRREFLKGIAALGVGALLGGCKPEKTPSPIQSPSPQPTPEPTKTSLKTPTIKEATTIPIPEPTPTKEKVLNIPSVVINEELLKKAFAGIGGGETLANGQGEETTLISFGHDYVSQAWGKEIDFKNLSEDPVASLQYVISLGSYQGTEGIFSPGKRGEETIFPQLADLSFPRLTLDNVLSKAEQEGEEYQKYVSPQNFKPREGTQMTVIGLFNEPQSEAGIIIDKNASGGELNYTLVAFTDYLRVSEEGIPRHYFAILPTHFPADPENKNTLTLKNLLEANGYQYDSQTQQITLDSDNGQTALALNQIKGEELIQEIRQAVGLYSVDQVGGKLVNNPIVPYYQEMPAVWEVEEIKDEEGNITSLLLKGQDQEGEMTDVAQARYDWEEDGWRWEEIGPEPEIPQETVMPIEGLETRWNDEAKRWEYIDSEDNCLVGYWNKEEEKVELNPDLRVMRARWKGLFTSWTAQEAEAALLKSVDVENQQARIPLPLDFSQGEILRGKSLAYLFCFRQIPEGTVLYAPFEGRIEKFASAGVGGKRANVDLTGLLRLGISFVGWEDYLGGEALEVKAGTPLVRFSNRYIPKKAIISPNPGDYQAYIVIMKDPDTKPLDITFKNNLLTDEKGRVVCLKGNE